MKSVIILVLCLFVQTSYALNVGKYQGTVSERINGNIVDSGLTLIAFITEENINGVTMQLIEFYDSKEFHKPRTSRYQIIEDGLDVFRFGHFALAERGSFDTVTPVRYLQETVSKQLIPPIGVEFADGSFTALRSAN